MPLRYHHAVDGLWIPMTLLNSWTAGSITPAYMKDSRGRVHLRGKVVSPSGLAGVSACWTPPAGHVPLVAFQYFDWAAGGAPAGTDGAPKTVAVLGGSLNVNYDAAGAPDNTAGKVSTLYRMGWQTT